MEIVFGLGVLIAALWARSVWRARKYEAAMALRRMEFHDHQDVFQHTWTFDFVEMLAVYQFLVLDGPSAGRDSLYELRRIDGPRWELRMHPECTPHELASLERAAAEFRAYWSDKKVARRRREIHASAEEWSEIDAHRSAQLETHYQLFLSRYTSVEPPVSLDEYWRRLVALKMK